MSSTVTKDRLGELLLNLKRNSKNVYLFSALPQKMKRRYTLILPGIKKKNRKKGKCGLLSMIFNKQILFGWLYPFHNSSRQCALRKHLLHQHERNEKERSSLWSQSESLSKNSLLKISGDENSVSLVKRFKETTLRPTKLSNRTEEGSIGKVLNRRQVSKTKRKIERPGSSQRMRMEVQSGRKPRPT